MTSQSKPTKRDVLVAQVCKSIESAIARNFFYEILIVIILIIISLVGILFLSLGSINKQWQFIVPGGIFQISIIWPIGRLVRLREENIRLRVLPDLIPLAGTDEQQAEMLTHFMIWFMKLKRP